MMVWLRLFTENPNAPSRDYKMVAITQAKINFKIRYCFRINTTKFVIHRCLVADATTLALELLCWNTNSRMVYNLVLL